MTAHRQEKEVVYPIIFVEINGVKTRALPDTGAGSSYASTKLIDLLRKRPKIYSAPLGAVNEKFNMNIELTKVYKPQLLTIDNPNYATLLSKCSHLKGVNIDGYDSRPQIPIHVVLGASEYATIKTSTAQRVENPANQ